MERAFYLLYFPIDVYLFKNDRRYTRVEFGIELNDSSNVDAMDLCPQDVYGSEQATRKYTLQLSPRCRRASAVRSGRRRTRDSPDDHHVRTGQVEVRVGVLDGTYYSDVVCTEKKYGYYWKKTASADRSFSVTLTDAEALSERWWTNALTANTVFAIVIIGL